MPYKSVMLGRLIREGSRWRHISYIDLRVHTARINSWFVYDISSYVHECVAIVGMSAEGI